MYNTGNIQSNYTITKRKKSFELNTNSLLLMLKYRKRLSDILTLRQNPMKICTFMMSHTQQARRHSEHIKARLSKHWRKRKARVCVLVFIIYWSAGVLYVQCASAVNHHNTTRLLSRVKSSLCVPFLVLLLLKEWNQSCVKLSSELVCMQAM